MSSSSVDVGDAEQGHRPRVAHAVRARARDQLVEHRQGVPRAAPARPHDQREHRRLDRHALGLGELLQIGPEHGRRDQPERVVVGARRMVPSTFSGSVVAKMNFTYSGGSSTSLSSALKPADETMCASSIT